MTILWLEALAGGIPESIIGTMQAGTKQKDARYR